MGDLTVVGTFDCFNGHFSLHFTLSLCFTCTPACIPYSALYNDDFQFHYTKVDVKCKHLLTLVNYIAHQRIFDCTVIPMALS